MNYASGFNGLRWEKSTLHRQFYQSSGTPEYNSAINIPIFNKEMAHVTQKVKIKETIQPHMF